MSFDLMLTLRILSIIFSAIIVLYIIVDILYNLCEWADKKYGRREDDKDNGSD